MKKLQVFLLGIMVILLIGGCSSLGDNSLGAASQPPGKIPLYNRAKEIKLGDTDREALAADTFGRPLLDYSSTTRVSWTKDSADKVKTFYDHNLPRDKWRSQGDWAVNQATSTSTWQKEDLSLYIQVMDNLTGEPLVSLGRRYGILDLPAGSTVVVTFLVDTTKPLPDVTGTETQIAIDATPVGLTIPALDIPTVQVTEENQSSTTSQAPVEVGLWQVTVDPTITDGQKRYLFYLWLQAKQQPISLDAVPEFCQATKAPYLQTQEGNKYDVTPGAGCTILLAYEGLTLYPGVPVTGKATFFRFQFMVPAKEKLAQLYFPTGNSTFPLDKIIQFPYVNMPSPDLTLLHNIQTPVKLDTFDVEVPRITVSSLAMSFYLVKVDVRITNHDPSSNYQFSIDRSLFELNGFALNQLEPSIQTYIYSGTIVPTECPNYPGGPMGGHTVIPAGSVANTSFCFYTSKLEESNAGYVPVISDSFIFFMRLNDQTIGFYGKAEQAP